ncbi:MAG: hypothetical protein KME08_22130 [Aphanothece sp. CMT-3BRIN-NPC111]|jgi:hypothetical protein|nr:hypothetical protein [Aphanothece sp. CMT-3BRIN-NPC111]
MFSYLAYGLGIHSQLPLPELVSGEATTDVVIQLGKVTFCQSDLTRRESHTQVTAAEAKLFYKNVGTFLVRGGREIIIDPVLGVEERVLRLFILGSALGVLLHQRGLLVLHSSAIAVNDTAVAFLGGSGWGKSTTAGAFHRRGYAVMADDVVAVQMDAGYPMLFPGFPRLKLWPEAAVYLGDDLETLPQLHPDLEKRNRSTTEGFSQDFIPLKRIYVLAEGESQAIEVLKPQEAFKELVGHSYAVGLLKATGTTSSHFRQCIKLANCLPICRLIRPRSLLELPALTQMVEADLANAI